MRGMGYSVRPTDLSAVLDPHACSSLEQAGTVERHELPQCGHGQVALTLLQHPGLVVFPGFLQPAQQLSFTKRALTAWCEPPAKTNHYVQQGFVTGLWAAATQGMVWQLSERFHEGSRPDVAGGGEAAVDALQGDLEGGSSSECEGSANSQCGQVDTPGSTPLLSSELNGEHGERNSSGESNSELQPPRTFSECWRVPSAEDEHDSRRAKQPSAAKLLRRLRWVTLGPPFDWTQRTYDVTLQHR